MVLGVQEGNTSQPVAERLRAEGEVEELYASTPTTRSAPCSTTISKPGKSTR